MKDFFALIVVSVTALVIAGCTKSDSEASSSLVATAMVEVKPPEQAIAGNTAVYVARVSTALQGFRFNNESVTITGVALPEGSARVELLEDRPIGVKGDCWHTSTTQGATLTAGQDCTIRLGLTGSENQSIASNLLINTSSNKLTLAVT
jgi:hypothetical protein